MAMRQFKAESKKLLDLMINSIYTNREIFLRELISNASDACDKRYFKSLTDTSIGITKDDLKIHIQPDKDSRTLTITDNGIGINRVLCGALLRGPGRMACRIGSAAVPDVQIHSERKGRKT